MCRVLVSGLLISLFASCITPSVGSSDFDRRDYLIQTLSLFNQKKLSLQSNESWGGDWLYRRMRLALIDEEMRALKPDLLIMQQVMSRQGSSSEDDLKVLHAGALLGYEYDTVKVSHHPDTDEVESLAVSLARPLSIRNIPEDREREWSLGDDGYLAAFLVRTDDQPIAVFNVQMPSDLSQNDQWYDQIRQRMSEFLKKNSICRERAILAGYFSADDSSNLFGDFLESSQLKSTAMGFCQAARNCFTATPENELFAVTESGSVPAHSDRIYVHKDAYVFTARRFMAKSREADPYLKRFSLNRLWPTQRFGWEVSTLLQKCVDAD